MGITDKVSQISQNFQEGAKTTSISLFNWALKIVSGLVYGMTFALIGQTMMAQTALFAQALCLREGAVCSLGSYFRANL